MHVERGDLSARLVRPENAAVDPFIEITSGEDENVVLVLTEEEARWLMLVALPAVLPKREVVRK